ncbi:ABC transporter substrate-binding protein [Phycicoccus sp. CSK15P-2]|uniref:ABC transporter substrate-binding protein n=1 Tax=Phycicoccus sp. CSK15P-2 TaxID=2807627 RepID=UPI0019501DB5|nr:ABC transporter substrate-binding protein [Phycicoccus sp. CSK15P-2]MBM6404537.1 ABC transporter substrate-binding protein [Phycicoccus sp. CSK15P-2]
MTLRRPALALCLSATLVAGCSGGGGEPGASPDAEPTFVEDGTFTMALQADPGNLDPHSSASSALFTVSQLAYDSLVSVDGESGEILPQLAAEWSVDGTTVTFTLVDGVTCSDDSPFTAQTVADNIAYVGDPENESPFLGTFLPPGATATADEGAGTVTLTLAQPAPFVLNGLASLPMVCDAGLEDRGSLTGGSAGTGPFRLTEAVPGDHYTYTRRDGYSWGKDGASTDAPGTPATVTMRIIENESTAANLLLSGEVNASEIMGPDAERLEQSGLFAAKTPALIGEQWYNQGSGHPTSEADVRMALTQALDLAELQSVLTAGKGAPATTLAALPPTACPGDSVSGSLPAQDVEAAEATLSGLPAMTFLYDSSAGSAVAAAAELAVQQWKAAGADVTAKGQDATALQQAIFGTGDWDIAWVPLNVNSPDQLVPFLSGPGAAEGGTNFAGIENADYAAAAEKASALSGAESCAAWLEGDSAVVAAADVVPFANNVVRTYGKGARFEIPGELEPTSIRLVQE